MPRLSLTTEANAIYNAVQYNTIQYKQQCKIIHNNAKYTIQYKIYHKNYNIIQYNIIQYAIQYKLRYNKMWHNTMQCKRTIHQKYNTILTEQTRHFSNGDSAEWHRFGRWRQGLILKRAARSCQRKAHED